MVDSSSPYIVLASFSIDDPSPDDNNINMIYCKCDPSPNDNIKYDPSPDDNIKYDPSPDDNIKYDSLYALH